MEIFVEVLVAWDPATQESKKGKGILGPVEAWARTDEEQGRKTLHGHFLFWIEGMNKCRNDFWYGSKKEREEARDCFAKYADQVMRASYPGFRIKLPCCGVGEARSPREVVSELDLQVRFSCMSFSSMCPTNTSRPNSKDTSERPSSGRMSQNRRQDSQVQSVPGAERIQHTGHRHAVP